MIYFDTPLDYFHFQIITDFRRHYFVIILITFSFIETLILISFSPHFFFFDAAFFAISSSLSLLFSPLLSSLSFFLSIFFISSLSSDYFRLSFHAWLFITRWCCWCHYWCLFLIILMMIYCHWHYVIIRLPNSFFQNININITAFFIDIGIGFQSRSLDDVIDIRRCFHMSHLLNNITEMPLLSFVHFRWIWLRFLQSQYWYW